MAGADKPRIGISSCLLGQEVRYDGGHKHDRFITGTLGNWFEFVPVCPELAIGLGVPREPIRLEGDPQAPRAVGVRDRSIDVTRALSGYGQRMGRELDDLCGYVFKSRSPSCGMERVKVYGGATARKSGVGLYARAFLAEQPLLPAEEEGRLNDPMLRENFIARVFAFRRWRELNAARLTPAALVRFHTRHKLLLLAHRPQAYRELGRLVADAGRGAIRPRVEAYGSLFMDTLARRATRRSHVNVLQHLAGYLKRRIDADDRAELAEVIEQYRLERVPLIVPITLLKHHFRRHPDPYVADQVYLEPHPAELALRNSI